MGTMARATHSPARAEGARLEGVRKDSAHWPRSSPRARRVSCGTAVTANPKPCPRRAGGGQALHRPHPPARRSATRTGVQIHPFSRAFRQASRRFLAPSLR
jgi:hypothetical protein